MSVIPYIQSQDDDSHLYISGNYAELDASSPWNYGHYQCFGGDAGPTNCPDLGPPRSVTARVSDALALIPYLPNDVFAVRLYFNYADWQLSGGYAELGSAGCNVPHVFPGGLLPSTSQCGPFQRGPTHCRLTCNIPCEMTNFDLNIYDQIVYYPGDSLASQVDLRTPLVLPIPPNDQVGLSPSAILGSQDGIPVDPISVPQGFLGKLGASVVPDDLIWTRAEFEAAEFTFEMEGGDCHSGATLIELRAYQVYSTV